MSDILVEEEHNQQLITQAGNKEALELWCTVTVQSVQNDAYNLSARQMAILLTIYTKAGQHTIKSLSEYLNITKPPICRALDTLSKHHLIKRQVDQSDRRIIYIQPTDEGYQYLGRFSNNIMDKLVML